MLSVRGIVSGRSNQATIKGNGESNERAQAEQQELCLRCFSYKFIVVRYDSLSLQ